MNRSCRITYLVLVLIFAVALSTALLLAGERNADSQSKNVYCPATNAQPAHLPARLTGCLEA